MAEDHGYHISDDVCQSGVAITVPSEANGRAIHALVFTPANYEHSQQRYPVVFQLHGVNKQTSDEQGLRRMLGPDSQVQHYADFFNVIVVQPHVGNTYYVDAPADPSVRMATFCGEELPAYIDQHYRTLARREYRYLSGFSMGGYGAISLLCRYPETFSVALSRGGALDPAYAVRDACWMDVGDEMKRLFGEYWDNGKHYHQHAITSLLNRLGGRDDIAIVQEVGVDDFLYPTNQRVRKRLQRLRIPHIYAEVPGGHQWSSAALLSLLAHLQHFRPTRRLPTN